MNSIFLFRRDLSIYDNNGYINCLKNSKTVYPIFIFTEDQISSKNKFKSEKAINFMCESLIELKKDIPTLICFYGDDIKILKYLILNNNIHNIYTNTDYTPFSIKRDAKIEKLCKENNVNFCKYHNILLFDMNSILTTNNTPYLKFTPYYNKIMKTKQFPLPLIYDLKLNKKTKKISNTNYDININKIYNTKLKLYIKGGRKEGLKKIKNLKNQYDECLINNTTQLSPYIKFGCISIREALYYFNKNNNKELIRQLIWREFYYNLYKYFPDNMNKKYDKLEWDNKYFKQWCNGKTGVPVVDAIMRDFNKNGYIGNRHRLIVGSFLVKVLLCDWKLGEKYFAQNLIDYDPLVNNGNWQWISGSGVDSQPYFRIFNPYRQSLLFDPKCEYIKKYIPELQHLENNKIHNWDKHYDESIYLKPIVNYYTQKKYIIKKYGKIF